VACRRVVPCQGHAALQQEDVDTEDGTNACGGALALRCECWGARRALTLPLSCHGRARRDDDDDDYDDDDASADGDGDDDDVDAGRASSSYLDSE
jgi:hypothetical protein